ADFDVDPIHRSIGVPTKQRAEGINHLIKDEGVVGMPADRQTFFVAETGLFDVYIHVAHRPDHTHGVVHTPAGVGVGNQAIAVLQFLGDGVNAVNVHVRVAADFELKALVSFTAVAGDAAGHRFGRFL